MESEAKKFLEVFGGIKLSANVKSVFKNADVYNISVSRANRKLKVIMGNKNVVNEEAVEDFNDDLLKSFPFVDNVEIDIKYLLEDKTLNEKIEEYWGNILRFVKAKSVLCYSLFQSANKTINNSMLEIELDCNGAFICKAHKLDIMIAKIINERFAENVTVTFKNKKKIKTKKVKNLLNLKRLLVKL